MAHRFSIGVEEEFQIINPDTLELRSHVVQLLSAAALDSPRRFQRTEELLLGGIGKPPSTQIGELECRSASQS
jgi:hypothetical protein